MAVIAYDLRITSDRTIRVKVGRMREYISLEHKSKGEIFDAVKYALLSKGAFVNDEILTEDLHYLIWRHIT